MSTSSPLKGQEIYVQNPLTARKDIRLLRFDPTHGDGEQVLCTMQVASWEEQDLEYDALSYCWGEPNRDCHMIINGHAFPITASLENALRAVRQGADKLLWIDQICINQSDEVEKSDQVGLMTRIYSGSRRCYCYLGQEDKYTHPALMRAAYLHSQYTELPFLLRAPIELPPNFTKDGNLVPSEDDGISLYRLFNRPYFSRRWIVQEVCVSKFTIGICGRYHFSMIHLLRAHDLQVESWMEQGKTDHLALSTRVFGNTSTLWKLNTTWHGYGSIFPLDLPTLLNLTGQFQSTDPRDTFYSVVGITNDTEDFPSVDYTQSSEQVFLTFTKALVSKGYGWLCLSRASGNTCHGLPSWVPNWSISTTSHLKNPLNLLLGAPSVGEAEPTLNRSDELTLESDGRMLKAKVSLLEQVYVVSDLGDAETSDSPLMLARLKAGHRLMSLASETCENDMDFLKRIAALIMPLTPDFGGDIEVLAQVLSVFSSNPDLIPKAPENQVRVAAGEDLESGALTLGFANIWANVNIVVTKTGKLCLAPAGTKVGAMIAVFEGAKHAILLEELGENKYAYVGPVSLESFETMESPSSDQHVPAGKAQGTQNLMKPSFLLLA